MKNNLLRAFSNSVFSLFIFSFLIVQSVDAVNTRPVLNYTPVVTVTPTIYQIPAFPSCLNPQGTIIAQYNGGTHGVPGDTNTYIGTDVVYSQANGHVIQCLCIQDGQGIQTNWLSLLDLSESDIQSVLQQGWTYIADGSIWGLGNHPYAIKNEKYICRGGVGGSGGGSQGGSSGSSSSGSSAGVSSVVGSVGEVLGLASTGNSAAVLFYLVSGVTLLSLGFYLKSVHTRKSS